MTKKASLLLILFCTLAGLAPASVFPPRPSPVRWVNNLSAEMPDFLSPGEIDSLENKLSAFAAQTSNQIVIVIVDTLDGLEPFDYATELGRQWGVGQSDFNNGIVILIKPTGGEGQRNLFIAIGYGLEGAIPDATTTKIRNNEMYPYFKTGKYYIALDKATDVLTALAKGEYNSEAYNKVGNSAGSSWLYKEYNIFGYNVRGEMLLFGSIIGLFISIFVFVILRAIYKAIRSLRNNWISNKDKPKLTVKEFFINPFETPKRNFSWLLILVLVLLVLSRVGIGIIIIAVIIAKITKKPGSESYFNGSSGGSSSGSSSGWSSSSRSSSSSSFGGGSFGGGGSGGNW